MRLITFTLFSILFFFCSFGDLAAQANDCSGAEVICGDGPVSFTPIGAGADDFANPNNNDGCLSNEHQSAWYYFEFDANMPPDSDIEFSIDPNGGSGEDYDFAVFGPNVNCDNLGFPIRCSWAASSCGFCPQTGLGNGATDNSEGAGGDGFVAPLVVQPGQGFYLLVDNWLGSSNGFQLTWGGSAAPFLNCDIDPGCSITVNAGSPQSVCAGDSPFQLMGVANGVTGTESYQWTATNGGEVYLSSPSVLQPTVTIPAGFSGSITYTLTVTEGACIESASITITVAQSPAPSISGEFSFCPGQFVTLDAGAGYNSYQWSSGSISQTANINTPGTVTVTVTNADGCPGVASVNVTQTPGPDPVITGELAVCQGGTATLDVGAGYNFYQWSNGGDTQTTTVTEPGTVSVTVTNADGCSGTAQVDVLNAPGPNPEITGDDLLCQGQTAVLDAGPGYSSYTWSDNTFNQTTTISGPGAYSVTVTDVDGCLATATLQVNPIPSPQPEITGTLTICPGEPTALNVGAGYDSYLWSDNSTTQSISVSTAGTFIVTVTDADGCEGTASATVTEIPPPTPTISGDFSVCTGETTQLDAYPGYSSYLWSDNSTGTSIQATPGLYFLTVTDDNGCEGVTSVTVTENEPPAPAINGQTDICPGGNTMLSVPPGYATYLWSDNSTGNTVNASIPGTYSVTVTDVEGCEGIASVTVSFLDIPQPVISGQTNFCQGGNTTLDAGPGYSSYDWSSGGSGQQIDVSIPGDYTVTVVNTDGCEGTATVSVEELSPPSPVISGLQGFCQGTSATLDAGAGYDTYAWSDGQSAQTATFSAGGTYEVTVTDAEGCEGTDSFSLTELDLPVPAISGDLQFCENASTTLDAGPDFAAYLWSDSSTTQTISADEPGIYGVTVTSSDGCEAAVQVTVDQISAPQPQIEGLLSICPGESTSLEAGAVYDTYLWSDGSDDPSISVDTEGVYGLTVTNSEGCQGETSAAVSFLPEPDPQISGAFFFCQGGTTLLDAGPGFTSYLWSDNSTGQQLSVNTPGTYGLTVTNGDGCSADASAMVEELNPPAVNISGELIFCADASTLLDAGPGYATYQWSDNSSGQTLEVTAAGSYGLTVTDDEGCEATAEVAVETYPLPEPVITGLLSFCSGGSTSIGLAQTYNSYSWSNGLTTSSIEINTAGDYIVTVTDVNGCSAEIATTIEELESLEPEILGSLSFCAGESTLLEGAPGYATYSWSNGTSGPTVSVDQPGMVELTVTDDNGCSGATAVMVVQNELPEPAISGVGFFCEGGSTSLDAGAGYASYSWSNGDSLQVSAISSPGMYEVTVTDGNACEAVASLEVTELPPPEIQINGELAYCPGNSTTLNPDNPDYSSYEWSNGESTTSIIADMPGTYTLTVTDDSGCLATASVEVSEYELTDPVISGQLLFCPGTTTQLDAGPDFEAYQWSADSEEQQLSVTEAGSYSVTVTDVNGCQTSAGVTVAEYVVNPPQIAGQTEFCSGGNLLLDAGADYVSYIWSDSATTSQTLTVTEGGDYEVTVTDLNGCESSAEIEVTENPLPQVTIGGSTSFCVGSFTTLNSGGTYEAYIWSTGEMTNTIQVDAPGSYALTVTDANGCINSAQVQVSEDIALNPVITGAFAFCENEATTLDAGAGYATYLWSDGSAGQTLDVDQAGAYSVTVTDAGGCSGETEITVIENPLPQPAIQGLTSFCSGASTSLDAGNGYEDYLWSNNADDPQISVSEAGLYSVTVTDGNGCSAAVSVEVEELPLPVFEIGGPDFFCLGESTTLTVPENFEGYEWSTGDQSPSIEADLPEEYSVTVTNEFGCADSRSMEVEEIPLPLADAGEDLVLNCDISSVMLGGENSTSGTGYQFEWAGPGIAPDQVNMPFPEVGTEGTYSLVITDLVHGCISELSEVSVTNEAYEPQVVLQVLDMIDCTSSSVIIDGTESEEGVAIVYQWYDPAGNPVQGATTAMLEASQPGMYSLQVLDTLTGCSAIESAMVQQDLQYPQAQAGLPQHLDCRENSVSLDASASSSGNDIIYFWETANGNIQSGGNSTMPVVTEPGVYVLSVMDTLNGCVNTDSVTVSQDTDAPTANAGQDQELDCNISSVILDGSASSSGSNFMYEWTLEGDPAFGQTGLTAEVSGPGIYVLQVTDLTNGCIDTDVVTVNENEAAPSELALTVDDPTCFGDSDGSIGIEEVTGGTAPYVYRIDGQPFGGQTFFPGLSGGAYEITVQDANGCEISTSVSINPGNDLDLNLGEDVYIDLGQTAKLNALINIPEAAVTSFAWESRDTIDCPECRSIEVGPLRTTEYSGLVVDENGCVATDQLTVFVNRPYEVFIPNIFSPNNDGVNDIFLIFAGDDVAEIRSFLIFNRWGESVFEVFNFPPNDPAYGWNGQFRARAYNAAVFVYMAEVEFIDGEVRLFKGDVTLMR